MGARWLFTALVGLTTAMGALTACAPEARGPVPDDLLVRYERAAYVAEHESR